MKTALLSTIVVTAAIVLMTAILMATAPVRAQAQGPYLYNENPGRPGTYTIYDPRAGRQVGTYHMPNQGEGFCQLCAEKEEARVRYEQRRRRAEAEATWNELRAIRRELRELRGQSSDDDE